MTFRPHFLSEQISISTKLVIYLNSALTFIGDYRDIGFHLGYRPLKEQISIVLFICLLLDHRQRTKKASSVRRRCLWVNYTPPFLDQILVKDCNPTI
jgi:hypothetical protein